MDEGPTFYCTPEEIALSMEDGCLCCIFGRSETEAKTGYYYPDANYGRTSLLKNLSNVKVQVYCTIKPTVKMIQCGYNKDLSERFIEVPAMGGYLTRSEFINRNFCKDWYKGASAYEQEKEAL